MCHPLIFALLSAAAALPQSSPDTAAPAWPQFRGPGGLAVADDTPIPTDFGPKQRVLWKASVPAGHSSPCVIGPLILLTGFEEGHDVVVALDRASGALRWKKRFEGEEHPDYLHSDAGPALSTACTDGERAIVYFGNYGLVALKLDGELAWERRLPLPAFGFSVGTSPILVDGKVVLIRDGAPEAAILAFDAATGEDAWKVDRLDYGESHGSPFVWRNAERTELVIGGTRRLCSFAPADGELLWIVDGTTLFPCTTPTADAETLYFAAWSTPNATGRTFWEAAFGRSMEVTDEEIADPLILFRHLDADGDGIVRPGEVPECRAKDAFGFLDMDRSGTWEAEEFMKATKQMDAPGKNLLLAVARGGKGDVSESHVRWSWERGLPYVACPLLYQERIWLVQAGGLVSAIDARSGKPVFDRERLSDHSEYYLSPVGAAGLVLVGSAEGTLYLLDASSDELEVVHTAVFDEELFATPAVLEGKVYLRTKSTLWAFGAAED